MIPCVCKNITEQDWRKAVAENFDLRAKLSEDEFVKAVRETLGKPEQCGKCRPMLKEIARKVIKIVPVAA